ncbi:MAG: hypothetical protein QOI54_3322 [Actinomycetota bacterium]|jgi:hypothetical protein|nr:hypothetical protein [Actinomycetota bacterium]
MHPPIRSLVPITSLLLFLCACGGTSTGTDDSADAAPATARAVSAADYGADWPLTVDHGTLKCDGSDGVGEATIDVDGTTYALNGIAKGNTDFSDIDPIWAANPDVDGLKKDISVLIDDALKLCK